MIFRALLGCLIVGATLAYESGAAACGALPYAEREDVLPADGSNSVPPNTELRVLYFGSIDPSFEEGCSPDLGVVRLISNGGEIIEIEGTLLKRPAAAQAWVVAKPSELLKANTEYSLQIEASAGDDPCCCDERQWIAISTFTTGASSDVVAPVFDGITSAAYGERLEQSSDCGEVNGFPLLPEFTSATDEGASPRYNIYVDGVIEKRYVESIDVTDGTANIFVNCAPSALVTWAMVDPGSRIEARAVDLAGNESAAHSPLTVDVVCDSADGSIDAGNGSPNGNPDITSPDASTSSDPELVANSSSDSSGCAVGGAFPSSPPFSLWWLSLLALLRRRRTAS